MKKITLPALCSFFMLLSLNGFAQEEYDNPYVINAQEDLADFSVKSDDYEANSVDVAECEEECPGTVRGKFDLGAAYVHVDVLLSGHTRHRMDMGGVRSDFYYRVWKGFVIRPTILYAQGKKRERLLTGGIGVGFCIPYKQKYCLTPVGGINWGELHTVMDHSFSFPNPVTGLAEEGIITLRQRMLSRSPYVGFEFSYNFLPSWRLVFNYQYAWSRTRTKISGLPVPADDSKEKSQGSNYALLLEYDITSSISVNVGAAYNTSLSKERHGIRAYGCKAGLAYWF